jgi:hypothetical protein
MWPSARFQEAVLNVILCLLAFFFSVVKVPEPLVPQNGSSRVLSKDGKVRWTADWTMQQSPSVPRTVSFSENGVGDLSDFSMEARWSVEAVWRADSAFAPSDVKRTVTASDGTPLLFEAKHFDHEKNVVRFERRKGTGRLESSMLPIPPDTLAVEGLAAVLRFVPLDDHRAFETHVLTNEPHVYTVTFEWRGVEHVRTPAGEFDCYKVEMVPHVGMLNVFRPFISKTFFWFTVDAPHYWVKYTGPESGPYSRSVVMELTRNAR